MGAGRKKALAGNPPEDVAARPGCAVASENPHVDRVPMKLFRAVFSVETALFQTCRFWPF